MSQPKHNGEAVEPKPKVDLGYCAKKITVNHRLARNCAAQAVIYAAICGAAMNQAKEEVGHGQFTRWLNKHCPTVSKGSRDNYMKLATGMLDAIQAKFPTVGNFDLLKLPDPRDVKDTSNDKLVKALKHLTAGKTLTDLYQDFGIIKPRKKKDDALRSKLGERTGIPEEDHAAEAALWLEQAQEKLEQFSSFRNWMSEATLNEYVAMLADKLREACPTAMITFQVPEREAV